MLIISNDVILRPLEREDTSLILRWRNDSRIAVNLFARMPLSRGSHEAWFESYLRNQQEMVFIVQTKAGVPIGTIGLSKIDHRNQSAEFGRLMIGEEGYLGQGFAQNATMALLEFAFLEMNLNRLFLEIFSFNEDSIEICRRCGFKVEGTKRESVFARGKFQDVVVMSLLRREFLDQLGQR